MNWNWDLWIKIELLPIKIFLKGLPIFSNENMQPANIDQNSINNLITIIDYVHP